MEWAFTQKRFAFVVQFVKIKSVFAVPTMVLCPFLLNLLCHYSSSSRKLFNLKSATPFPKCYLHKEKWTFDS